MASAYHIPVLLNDCINGLNIRKDGVYVDATFGGGGHSAAILEKLGSNGKLFGIDQDKDAVVNVPNDSRFEWIDGNFEFIRNHLRIRGVQKVDGILADLGVSSHQFDRPERGFSIRFDGPLDMRMDAHKPLSAFNVVNHYEEDELIGVLRNYGELRNAAAVGRKIIQVRASAPLKTGAELVAVLKAQAPRGKENQFFARVFQAIRIEVNRELAVLEAFLQKMEDLLVPGGRLVVISYHSLEDRLVKNMMKSGNRDGIQTKDFYGRIIRPFRPINTQVIKASALEIENNNRARSARLRIAERVQE